MTRVLIIEDEPRAASRLEEMVRKTLPGAKIMAHLDSIQSSVEWFSRNEEPDLIFLDIQLADGVSFAIFENVKITVPVIFTTAYDEYAVKAFELNSVDYLLKPVKMEKLQAAIGKFQRLESYYGKNQLDNKISEVVKMIRRENQSFKSRFLIHEGDSLVPIMINDVAYFYAEGKEVFLVTRENQQYIIDFTLDKLETNVDPGKFFRLNRQFLVSVNSIQQISNYFHYKLKITLIPGIDKEIIISKARVKEFKAWMNL